jgi:uncharacterized membrane protein YphA (DoxX/SURF4 family)
MSGLRRNIWSRPLVVALLGLAVPWSAAQAHLKWFVDTDGNGSGSVGPFSLTEPAVLVWIGVIAAMTIVAMACERFLPDPPARFLQAGARWQRGVVWVLRLATGGWLLYASAQGTIFAPNLSVQGVATQTLLVVQIISGFLLVSGLWSRIAGKLLIALWIGALIFFGWDQILEHLLVVGIGLFLIAVPDTKQNPFTRLRPYAVPLLRLSLGISLMVLAFTEKLLNPTYGVEFLAHYRWNFMQALGIDWFDDRLFVLSAGMSEFLFGWLFLLGVVTRLNTITMAFFFVGSAITLGLDEVVGHLPVFAISAILILYGHGDKFTIARWLSRKRQRQASLPLSR